MTQNQKRKPETLLQGLHQARRLMNVVLENQILDNKKEVFTWIKKYEKITKNDNKLQRL